MPASRLPGTPKAAPALAFLQVGLNLVSSSRGLGNQVSGLGVFGFGFIEPGHKSIVAFWVLGLIEGNVGVLLDAILDELSCDVDFRFLIPQSTLTRAVVLRLLARTCSVYAYKLFFLVDYLIDDL